MYRTENSLSNTLYAVANLLLGHAEMLAQQFIEEQRPPVGSFKNSGTAREGVFNGHAQLALKVSGLLKRYPMVAAALARRHPFVICDEHQDSSGDQHALVMALLGQGTRVRVFADPMQKIFSEKALEGSCPPCDWNDLKKAAHACEELDVPHRWKDGSPALGAWTLAVRKTLSSGGVIDLTGKLPAGLRCSIH